MADRRLKIEAQIVLSYAQCQNISRVARNFGTTRHEVRKALYGEDSNSQKGLTVLGRKPKFSDAEMKDLKTYLLEHKHTGLADLLPKVIEKFNKKICINTLRKYSIILKMV